MRVIKLQNLIKVLAKRFVLGTGLFGRYVDVATVEHIIAEMVEDNGKQF